MWQRHATIFAREIGINLTPTQWAALAKLTETGPCSQNQLGRLTAMDVATIKGVIDRLTARGLTETSPDPEDGRRLLVSLTRAGQQLAEKAAPNALAISRETLAPLDAKERETLVALLNKLRLKDLLDRDGNFLRDHRRIERIVAGVAQHELERMLAGWKFDPRFGLARAEMKM